MTEIDLVSRRTTFTVVSQSNRAIPVELVWHSDDPVAAYLLISSSPKKIAEWVVSVDLLTAGLLTSVGLGDVRIFPVTTDLIGIALDSPSGHAVLHGSRAVISEFLAEVAGRGPVDVEPQIDWWLMELIA